MNDDLADMLRQLLQFRRERDWEQFHNSKDQLLSLALEAAEVLELAQWRQGEALDAHLATNKQALADELCDVLGWVLLIAHDHQINLPKAFADKMDRNRAKYPVDQAKGRAEKYTAYLKAPKSE
jgi:NTP pyrophosphatase (non-canonical NTP hydrolase)